MKTNLDDLTDDELFASYEAYKALIEAGLSKDQALSRTGLTAQIVKDFQTEEGEDDDLKSGFEDEWDEDGDGPGYKLNDDDVDDDDEWSEDSGYGNTRSDDYDDGY